MKITLDNLYDSSLDAETIEIVRDILETVGPLGFYVDDWNYRDRERLWKSGTQPLVALRTPFLNGFERSVVSVGGRPHGDAGLSWDRWLEELVSSLERYTSIESSYDHFEATLLLKALQGIKR